MTDMLIKFHQALLPLNPFNDPKSPYYSPYNGGTIPETLKEALEALRPAAASRITVSNFQD